jgi:hypothetical protein
VRGLLLARVAVVNRDHLRLITGEGGCAVEQAIADGELSEERWINYLKLLTEAKRHEEMTDRLAAAESRRRLKATHRRTREFCRRKDW